MPRCAHSACRRWRPGFLVRTAALGLYLDDVWYCSTQCLGTAVRERLAHTAPIVPPVLAAPHQPRLGGLIATQKRLAPSVVEQAASAQARSGLRIGNQLIELGLATKLDVLRALASQSGVGFLTALDPARLTNAPGNLSPAVVRALGVVPFEADRKHDVLKVACTAPVPRGALAALRELTGAIIEPYLVADDQWPALIQAYGAAKRAGAPAPTTLTDLESLASRVAAAARQAGAVRMSEAKCDDNLWVRLDVGGQIEEFVLMAPHDAAAFPRAALATRPRCVRTSRAPTDQPRARRPRVPKGQPVPSILAPVPALAAGPPPAEAPVRAAGTPTTAPVAAARGEGRPLVEAPVALSFLKSLKSQDVPLFER